MERKRKRRRWSETEKRGLVAEAERPGESVARVARRCGVHANMIYAWRKRMDGSGSAARSERLTPARLVPLAITSTLEGASGIELETPLGARLRIGAADASAAAAIVGAFIAATRMEAER